VLYCSVGALVVILFLRSFGGRGKQYKCVGFVKLAVHQN
jgi:hypothetical protein